MDKILNLGCGTDLWGTHRIDIKPTKATTHVFDVEKGIQFPDEFFDEIYERNLLEHLRNVGYHLDECFRVLKTGGRITVITDNASCTRFYTLGTHEGRYMGHREFLKHNGDKHYSVFTKEHLSNLFVASGFNILQIRYIDTDFKPTFVLDRVMRTLHLFRGLTYPRIEVISRK